MAKRLIVTADDMGLSRATTDAIFEAFQHGIVTSASLIVNLPGADYAFERLRATPGLDVGVHLNISGGFPITLARKIPSLVTSGGTFFPFEILKRRLWRGSVSSRDIEAEFRAQIRKMKDHGVTPTHANSHNHVHFHPLVARAFTRALLSEGITRARAPRHRHYPPNNQIGGAFRGPFYRRVPIAAYLDLLQVLAYGQVAHPDSCVVPSAKCRTKPELLEAGWRSVWENLPEGTYEFVVHPSTESVGNSRADDLPGRGRMELRLLTDPASREIINRHGIQLIPFSQL
jgi:predicted glycoside hydrolase/deacetylase ChbG (UPF0249 family)